jgi:hypothetical protein
MSAEHSERGGDAVSTDGNAICEGEHWKCGIYGKGSYLGKSAVKEEPFAFCTAAGLSNIENEAAGCSYRCKSTFFDSLRQLKNLHEGKYYRGCAKASLPGQTKKPN